jgi:hypothetical protein
MPKRARNATEKQREHLLYVLNSAPTRAFDVIKNLVPKNDALVAALAPHFAEFPKRPANLSTCCHCGDQFDPEYNGRDSCEVEHEPNVEEGEVDEREEGVLHHHVCGTTGDMYATAPCGCHMHEAYRGVWNYDEQFCYSGPHEVTRGGSRRKLATKAARKFGPSCE